MAEKLKSYITDEETGTDIAGAALYLLDAKGNRVKQLTTTNAEGWFEIDYPPFGTKIEADLPGYSPTVFDPAYILYGGIKLKADASSTGGEVIITGVRKKQVSKPSYVLPIAVGSAGIVCFSIWAFKVFS